MSRRFLRAVNELTVDLAAALGAIFLGAAASCLLWLREHLRQL